MCFSPSCVIVCFKKVLYNQVESSLTAVLSVSQQQHITALVGTPPYQKHRVLCLDVTRHIPYHATQSQSSVDDVAMSGLVLLVHLPFSLRTVVSLVFLARILTLNRRGRARRGVALRARCRLPHAYTLATNNLFAETSITRARVRCLF